MLRMRRYPWPLDFCRKQNFVSAKDQNTTSHAQCARKSDSQFRPNPIVVYLFCKSHRPWKRSKECATCRRGQKKQITGTFTVTMSGLFLPMQLIYEGETPRYLPKGNTFPDNLNLTFTPNHWSNKEKLIEHLEKVVFSVYRGETKMECVHDQPATQLDHKWSCQAGFKRKISGVMCKRNRKESRQRFDVYSILWCQH